MTPEEKEKYYSKYGIQWGDLVITGYVTKSKFINGIDDEHRYILDCITDDLIKLKERHDEVPEVSDNLDSE